MTAGKVPLYLVFGDGWIAGQIRDILKTGGESYEVTKVRLEDREAVLSELRRVQPTHVINAAGVRGTPNVDWCEDHKEETIRANIIGATNVVDCCFLLGIHVTHFSSGCIYDYDDAHPPGGKGYTEEEEPNFFRSFYSNTKIISEKAIKHYPNVLILRIRNPLSGDLHPKNTVTKLFGFKKLIDVPNSGTICPNLLPGAIILAKNGETGLYNFAYLVHRVTDQPRGIYTQRSNGIDQEAPPSIPELVHVLAGRAGQDSQGTSVQPRDGFLEGCAEAANIWV
ncbi:NRS/ER [Penicillium alfredii]|uniref:NRS/ER n=1 Tax=Penicillium alfredii TaxID=1506179 RepID=A0A9W9JZ64_9EURO|nr:uncharacterized protein NUU61_008202 [Penicillium alfredii]KAJ5086895.1 NRS/ER [Penicillium alfredii]